MIQTVIARIDPFIRFQDVWPHFAGTRGGFLESEVEIYVGRLSDERITAEHLAESNRIMDTWRRISRIPDRSAVVPSRRDRSKSPIIIIRDIDEEEANRKAEEEADLQAEDNEPTAPPSPATPTGLTPPQTLEDENEQLRLATEASMADMVVPAAPPSPKPASPQTVEEEDEQFRLAMEASMRSLPECPICTEPCIDLIHTTMDCDHVYCKTCLLRHINAELQTKDLIVKCPRAGCNRLIDLALMNAAFADSLDSIKRLHKSKQNLTLCGTVLGPAESCPVCTTWTVLFVDVDRARCFDPACARVWCRKCRCIYHPGKPCTDPQATSDKLSDVYIKVTTKPCPNCGHAIQHFRDHGCHHVTCAAESCKLQLCYVCMNPWIGHPQGTCTVSCNPACGCVNCPHCSVGKPCDRCLGNCDVCTGRVPPPIYDK